MGSPGGTSGKESTCQCRRHKRLRFDPWVRKIPWRRKWQLTLYCIGFAICQHDLPQVYTCSPSWTLLPPPSPYHPSGSTQCTSPKHPVSCIEPGLAIHFLYDIIHVLMPLGWPRGMVWGGRWEGGSGWGTRVYLWQIHVDVWQNQYNFVINRQLK